MANQGFQFKQFAIKHNDCAMKVGTDSIMLGSWVVLKNEQLILDIGTGSGLLAIMLAQKAQSSCQIIGIDIDSKAIHQAKQNADSCSWTSQLSFQQKSSQEFESKYKFDLIISNPPYFPINTKYNQKDSIHERVVARQTGELSHQTLLQNALDKLSDNGRFCCVLPADFVENFCHYADSIGLFCNKQLCVQAKSDNNVIRYLLEFTKIKSSNRVENIIIHNELGQYSADYIELCKDFYMNF